MEETKIGVVKRRKILVVMFYRYILMNNSNAYMLQDILDETQEKLDEPTTTIANAIVEKFDELIDDIDIHMSLDWKWERLPAVVRAMLIVGTYEVKYTNTSKAITINEMVDICKEFEPDFDYKFVNALLDKIIKL